MFFRSCVLIVLGAKKASFVPIIQCINLSAHKSSEALDTFFGSCVLTEFDS